MMREIKSFNSIFQKYLSGTATSAELEQLFSHFKTFDKEELRQMISREMENAPQISLHEVSDDHLETILVKINKSIGVNLDTPLKGRVRNLYQQVARIAAVFILISSIAAAIYIYSSSGPSNINPGGNYAVLRGSTSSKDLHASKTGVLFTRSGVEVSKAADGIIAYKVKSENAEAAKIEQAVVTPDGGQYKVKLSDGTLVVLNSGSEIQYPLAFSDTIRKVKLKGEAYFEVAKNRSKPFVVEVGNVKVRVLGTRFNVSSYEEDKGVKTTLLEGSVMLTSVKNKQQLLLKPDQQAIEAGNQLKIKEVEADDFAAWTEDRFVFKDEAIANVMHKLSRWYRFEVDYSSLPNKNLYLNISKQQDIQQVLEMISVTSNIEFRWRGNRLTVK
ncbi:FecR family protein [Desertivirga arenae]|uniref:FecR family protein n=1 Tax=Desertivirga arenae TaxID=2810309 RepID=UPI001A968753|nr:FecR family protein [Pedobacter sp. SYSU D00823]